MVRVMSEHSVIYLSPSDDPEREWCQDDVWENSVRYNLGADFDAQRLRADTAEAERDELREQLRERDATIENLNDRHDLGVQERDRLRHQLSAEKALRLENQRITPARFKCLACGEYHEGSSNLPCPKMSPYATLNQKSEGESQ